MAAYNSATLSAIDRSAGIVAIKPATIPIEELRPEKIVIADMTGNLSQNILKPSPQLQTHLEIYKHFDAVNSICNTYSHYATMWTQSCNEIPCFGSQAAEYFYGFIPVTESLAKTEIQDDYQANIGKAIVKRFEKLNPDQMPAVLAASIGPYTWGKTAAKAVEIAIALESVAKTAFGTVMLNERQKPISLEMLQEHYNQANTANPWEASVS